jgi:hypothetical protein
MSKYMHDRVIPFLAARVCDKMLSKIKYIFKNDNCILKTIMFRQKYDVDAVNFLTNWAK